MANFVVELASGCHRLELFDRVSGGVDRARKDHAPGDVGMAAPQLTADEIAEAADAETDRHQRRDEIHDIEEVQSVLSRPQPHRHEDADQAAMKGHAAFPDAKQRQRVGDQVGGAVEQHVTETATGDHADHAVEREVGKCGRPDRQTAMAPAPFAEHPECAECNQVHDAVPVHGERTHRKRQSDRNLRNSAWGFAMAGVGGDRSIDLLHYASASGRQDTQDEALQVFGLGDRRMHRMIGAPAAGRRAIAPGDRDDVPPAARHRAGWRAACDTSTNR